MPFFSVIIPLYNKEDHIADTLNSVLNQSFQDFEVIIVNDGSTDGSLEVVSKFQDQRIRIFGQQNQGASVARNYGIEQAQSDLIALLDADDIWYNNHLAELKKLTETFPGAGLFCSNYEVKRSRHLTTPAKFNFKYDDSSSTVIENFFEASSITFIPTSSSVAFFKLNFNNIGGYNTSIKSGQDIDLWIRMGLKYKVAFCPKVTMLYNFFIDNSLSKSLTNKNRYSFINAYKQEETENVSLKKYLDINRFALAIRCILNNEFELYKTLKTEIEYKNLNFKQKILIHLPKWFLKLTKGIQRYFIRNNIYLSAYR